jgi:hypothetical protein
MSMRAFRAKLIEHFDIQWKRSAVRCLNDDPSLCATLYTVVGVGELYQRRSSLL